MTDTTPRAPTQSVLHAQLRDAGAVFFTRLGREMARHYDDPGAEYRAVRETAGFAERSDRARFRLWGRDPVRMVQGLITNDLQGAPADRAVYAAMLTAKGRMVADLRAIRRTVDGGAEVLLDLGREALEGTREHLRKFVPPLFARWAEATDEVVELGVYGPRARMLLARALGQEVPALAEEQTAELPFAGGSALLVGTRDTGLEEGFDVFVAAGDAPALWDRLREEGAALGARPVGFGTLEVLRIEAGRPRYGADLTEEVIPTEAYEEAGLLQRAISFTKGCYTGQEVIIRIAHRGHVNRHLRGLLLGDAPPPATRTSLFAADGGKEVGWITSPAHSPKLGQTIAMGFVRREVEPGGTVRVGGADGPQATVVTLPFASAG